MNIDDGYFGTCYSAAEKAGRSVRMTDQFDYPICSVCESRFRNGLKHYIPSNGTEGMMFQERCEDCIHFRLAGMEDATFKACEWGILDKLMNSAWSDHDSALSWYDPADMDVEGCPATCRRFTHKDDGDRDSRMPPPRDAPGQMFLGEVLTVKEAAVRTAVAP